MKTSSPTQLVFRAMIIGTVAVAAFMFVLSFVGLRDYGVRLMRLDAFLAPLVPLGVDVFSVVGIAATYLLRRAPWHVRLYAWTVFLVPAALSVAGNLAHGEARGLVKAGLVGAALPPVLLALSVHLVVVTRRALDRNAALVTVPEQSSVAEFAQAEQPVSPPAEAVAEPAPRRSHNAVPKDVREGALKMLVECGSVTEVAERYGVDKATVRRWKREFDASLTARARQRPTKPKSGVEGGPADTWTDDDDAAARDVLLQNTSPSGEA